MVGVMDDSGRLPGPGALASPPMRPKAFGTLGLAAKSSSSLLSSTPVPSATRPDAKAEIERIGVGHRIAVTIHHGEMRGVAPSRGNSDVVTDLARGRRASVIDAAAQGRRVALGHQPRQRGAHDGGIAEIGGAVGIGATHGLDHQMQPRRLVEIGELVAFQDVQHLDQHTRRPTTTAASTRSRGRDIARAPAGARAADTLSDRSAVMIPPATCTAAAIFWAIGPS